MVAHGRRHLAGVHVLRRLEGEAARQRLEERGLHPLPAARLSALDQGHEDAEGREVPREQIADGNPDAERRRLGRAREPHEPRHPLHDLVVARPLAVRTLLAEAGDTRIDEPWVVAGECLVVDAEPVLDVGAVVLHDHVRPRREPLQDLDAARVLEVHGHAPLVAVEIGRVEEHALAPLAAGPLHAEHLGAEVREDLRAGGARADGGEIHHGEAGQGSGCVAHGSLSVPAAKRRFKETGPREGENVVAAGGLEPPTRGL